MKLNFIDILNLMSALRCFVIFNTKPLYFIRTIWNPPSKDNEKPNQKNQNKWKLLHICIKYLKGRNPFQKRYCQIPKELNCLRLKKNRWGQVNKWKGRGEWIKIFEMKSILFKFPTHKKLNRREIRIEHF